MASVQHIGFFPSALSVQSLYINTYSAVAEGSRACNSGIATDRSFNPIISSSQGIESNKNQNPRAETG